MEIPLGTYKSPLSPDEVIQVLRPLNSDLVAKASKAIEQRRKDQSIANKMIDHIRIEIYDQKN